MSLPVSETDDVIRAWCLEQAAPWLAWPLPRAEAEAAFALLNATEPNVFLFSLSNGRATLADKPLAARHEFYALSHSRARGYQMFLDTVAREHCPELDMPLAVYVGDAALAAPAVPVFAFQKPRGNRSLLLPDPDFLGSHFYAAADERDALDYAEKTCTAAFHGATTGGLITADMVRRLDHPRLHAFAHFRNHPRVTFRLPTIVQCDSEATAAMLRAMGAGDGRTATWAEQLRHRFLISVDGNGAACSRVARALLSNSVLLKFESPHVLYYFSALQPWRHYVPIATETEVEAVLQAEATHPGLFAPVAAAGRRFAQTLLSQAAGHRYTAQLLRLYARCIPPGGAARPAAAAVGLAITAHVQTRGDVTTGPLHWAGDRNGVFAIEGFVLYPLPGFAADDVRACGIDADGLAGAWQSAGTLCGTRGMARPLGGFAVRLEGDAARRYFCLYAGRFADGSEVGPLEDGAPCRADSGAALTAMQVMLLERHTSAHRPS